MLHAHNGWFLTLPFIIWFGFLAVEVLEDVAIDFGVRQENVVGGNDRVILGGAHGGQVCERGEG